MRRFIPAIRERALARWSQSSDGVVDLGPAGDDTAGSEIRRSPGTRPMRFPHKLQQAPRMNSPRDVATHRCRHLGLIFLAPTSVCQGVRPCV